MDPCLLNRIKHIKIGKILLAVRHSIYQFVNFIRSILYPLEIALGLVIGLRTRNFNVRIVISAIPETGDVIFIRTDHHVLCRLVPSISIFVSAQVNYLMGFGKIDKLYKKWQIIVSEKTPRISLNIKC